MKPGELKPKEDHGELDLDMILRLERQKESITVKEEVRIFFLCVCV